MLRFTHSNHQKNRQLRNLRNFSIKLKLDNRSEIKDKKFSLEAHENFPRIMTIICSERCSTPIHTALREDIIKFVNQAFRLYFSMGQINQAEKILSQLESITLDFKINMSDQVLFDYYVGRIHLYFHRFHEADENLSKSFTGCLKSHYSQRRYQVFYLVLYSSSW